MPIQPVNDSHPDVIDSAAEQKQFLAVLDLPIRHLTMYHIYPLRSSRSLSKIPRAAR
jgi:hypothetical protein